MTINLNNVGSGSVRDQGRTEQAAGSRRGELRENAPAEATDQEVSLSAGAQALNAAEASLANVPELDQGRVESIRQAIAEGRYHIDPARLAAKFIELEGELP